MTKGERGTREIFGIFRVLRLKGRKIEVVSSFWHKYLMFLLIKKRIFPTFIRKKIFKTSRNSGRPTSFFFAIKRIRNANWTAWRKSFEEKINYILQFFFSLFGNGVPLNKWMISKFSFDKEREVAKGSSLANACDMHAAWLIAFLQEFAVNHIIRFLTRLTIKVGWEILRVVLT